MNKELKKRLITTCLEIDGCSTQLQKILAGIGEVIDQEEESIDNLREYPQFESKADDKEIELDELREIMTTLEEKSDDINDIRSEIQTFIGLKF